MNREKIMLVRELQKIDRQLGFGSDPPPPYSVGAPPVIQFVRPSSYDVPPPNYYESGLDPKAVATQSASAESQPVTQSAAAAELRNQDYSKKNLMEMIEILEKAVTDGHVGKVAMDVALDNVHKGDWEEAKGEIIKLLEKAGL